MIRPLYKVHEPFMEVPKGFGYLGVIQYDDQEDKVQCHICGKYYKHVGLHACAAHKMSADNYKDIFGLTRKIALCSTTISKDRHRIINQARENGKMHLIKKMPKVFYKHRKYRNGQAAISFKNMHGLCDLQMFARYQVVKKIVKREPTVNELRKYDLSLYGAISNRGTLNEYKKKINVETRSKARPMMRDVDLVAHLRRWVHENSSRPRSSDFRLAKNGYPGRNVFLTHFGSWVKALTVAGIR